jgi:hypothetical protein
MVRSRVSGVSNHEAQAVAFVLREAAKAPLLRMRIILRSLWRRRSEMCTEVSRYHHRVRAGDS